MVDVRFEKSYNLCTVVILGKFGWDKVELIAVENLVDKVSHG